MIISGSSRDLQESHVVPGTCARASSHECSDPVVVGEFPSLHSDTFGSVLPWHIRNFFPCHMSTVVSNRPGIRNGIGGLLING